MTQQPTSSETPETQDETALTPETATETAAPEPEPETTVEAKPVAEKPRMPSPAAPRPALRETLRRPAPAPSAAAAAPAAAPKLQPSWVLSGNNEQVSREELLARYRRQRALPEDPFENGGRPTPPPGYRDRIMNEPRPAARFVERPAPEAAPPAPRRARSFTLGQTFAIAAGMALVASAGAGVLSARLSSTTSITAPAEAIATAPAAEAAPIQPAAPQLQLAADESTRTTVIDKKPVATATLQVADVSGETNSFIPLALHAEPGSDGNDMLLKISGIPEGAYLTSGHRDDDQIWSLSLAEVKDVKLVVPKAEEPQIDLAVAAFEPKTGELAAPVKTMTVALKDVVVEPTSAPPPQQDSAAAPAKTALPDAAQSPLPAVIPAPQSIKVAVAAPETAVNDQLLGDADALFKSGDVRAARKSYERAWGNDGSPAAAFGLARSYDPVVLATLALKNVKPDKAQAIQWYQRAASGGNADATEAIVRLQLKP